jgi:hypothetical protein
VFGGREGEAIRVGSVDCGYYAGIILKFKEMGIRLSTGFGEGIC